MTAEWSQSAEDLTINDDITDDRTQKTKIAAPPLLDFLSNSSIHGLKYLGQLNRFNRSGKIIWTLGLLVSAICCLKLTSNILTRFYGGPHLIHLTERPQPVWTIPFPAVTICPNAKTNNLFNYTEAYHTISENNNRAEDYTYFNQLSHFCKTYMDAVGTDTLDVTAYDDLRKLAPNMSETFEFCFIQLKYLRCRYMLREVWTENGLCFTFNMLNATDVYTSELSSEIPNTINNFTSNSGSSKTFQSHAFGVHSGLYISLKLLKTYNDFLCLKAVVGYTVSLHHPGEDPFVSSYNFQVPVGYQTIVMVKPKVAKISDSLGKYNSESRNCYLDSERKLKFFQLYTQRNCEVECLSNFIIEKCGCTKIGLPRNATTPLCGGKKAFCFINGKGELIKLNTLHGGPNSCNCLPACVSVTYDTEIAQYPYDYNKMHEALRRDFPENGSVSILSISYKDNYYSATILHEQHSFTDEVALIGGILALFFGASIVSFVELIYFSVKGILFYKTNNNMS